MHVDSKLHTQLRLAHPGHARELWLGLGLGLGLAHPGHTGELCGAAGIVVGSQALQG